MNLKQLRPPQPVGSSNTTWVVTFHNHRKIEVDAESAFESESRIYFCSAPQAELFPLVASGKAINSVVAAFDTEAVLYYSKMGSTRSKTVSSRKKS